MFRLLTLLERRTTSNMADHLCGRKRRRNVHLRFERTCRLRWVEKITNEMEIVDMWYALEDTRRFRREFEQESIFTEMSDYCVTCLHEGQEVSRVCRSQDSPYQSHSIPSSSSNLHQPRNERRRRQRQSQQSRDVVFKEQYFQYGRGLNDPESIARRYYNVSERPLKEAWERAQRVLADLRHDEPDRTSLQEDDELFCLDQTKA
jgi:hypothetical protein